MVGFQIKRIDHVVIVAADLDRSVAFYTEVLGCTLERVIESMPLYQMRAGDSLIDITTETQSREGDRRNMEHFCLLINPFQPDQLLQTLHDLGITCGDVEERYGATGYGRSIYIEDPDGNRIELKEA